MRELGLKPVGAKKYKATTNSKHRHPVFESLLMRGFAILLIFGLTKADIIWQL